MQATEERAADAPEQAAPAPAAPPPATEYDPATGVRSAVLRFDEDGYPDWWATVRVNPRARHFDALTSGDEALANEGFRAIVLDWNFRDGAEPLPLPKDGAGLGDLPSDLVTPFLLRYLRTVAAIAAAPKG